MRTYEDAKLMAKTLREVLAADSITISHSKSLEIVANQFGLNNWNVLAAQLDCDKPLFERSIPILRIFSVEKANEFYRDFLGFSEDWRHDSLGPLYMQISRGGLLLHLTEHHGDASPGGTIFAPMRNIDAFYAELFGKAYKFMHPSVESAPWGRMMAVTDPFGNRLRFCEYK